MLKNKRKIIGVFLILLFLLFGCIDIGTQASPESLKKTPPRVCITEITDKATGKLLFKKTAYTLGMSSRIRIDYVDKEAFEDEVLRSGASYFGEKEGIETVIHYIENGTHVGFVLYSNNLWVENVKEYVGERLYEKYFGDCKWMVQNMVVTTEESKLYEKEIAERLKNSAGSSLPEQTDENEVQKNFDEKYEKKETCSVGAFGEEMFIITQDVCTEEEIAEKYRALGEEYQSSQPQE